MQPKSIKRVSRYLLEAEWPDGFRATIKTEALRDECPCAECCGEFGERKGTAGLMKIYKEGRNDLKELIVTGNYAIAAAWGDGHDTGIYPWKLVREIFEKCKLSEEKIEALLK